MTQGSKFQHTKAGTFNESPQYMRAFRGATVYRQLGLAKSPETENAGDPPSYIHCVFLFLVTSYELVERKRVQTGRRSRFTHSWEELVRGVLLRLSSTYGRLQNESERAVCSLLQLEQECARVYRQR